MKKMLVEDIPCKIYFKYAGIVFEKLNNTKRSSKHPFDVNCVQRIPSVSRRTNRRGYILPTTEVEVFTTNDTDNNIEPNNKLQVSNTEQ